MKTMTFAVIVVPAAALAQTGSPTGEKSPVPYPHPLITEVL
jgi:hypothetical protein